jgi:AraC-like DNA-binding protein
VISRGFKAGGEWGLRFTPPRRLKLHAVMTGGCWILPDAGPQIRLDEGDVVILNGAASFVLASCPEARAVDAEEVFATSPDPILSFGTGQDHLGIGGHVELDAAGQELILSLLPPVTRVAADTVSAAELRPLLHRLLDEITRPRPGSVFAAEQHAQLVLVEVLRMAVETADSPPPGWLRLVADADLRPALNAIHREPARPWQLGDLARESAMSRSNFAARFRAAAGEPPVTYLNRWRIRLAQNALRDTDTTVAQLASELGYASESSFSHAFKRITAVSPRVYRSRERAAPSPLATKR